MCKYEGLATLVFFRGGWVSPSEQIRFFGTVLLLLPMLRRHKIKVEGERGREPLGTPRNAMEEGKTTKTLPQKKIQGLQGCKTDCLPIVRAIRTAYALSSQSKNLRLPEMTKTSKITQTFHALFAHKKARAPFCPSPNRRGRRRLTPSILYCSRRKLQRKKLARNQRKTSSSVRSGKRKRGRTRREKKGGWCWGELLLCPRAARQVLDCVYGKSLRK